ncbi:PhoX family protein [Paenibacillus sp. NPDC058174]|uniref:PhoX family protein n=1 Tax=Paenibacillus sp. NPDC058174 TaxID=3346366 RepID=UPI0036DCAB0A
MNYKKEVSRRSFLAFLGTGAAAFAASATGLDPLIGKAQASAAKLFAPAALPFPALQTTTENRLTVAEGYSADWLTSGDEGRYISFWPGQNENEGTLWVSHSNSKADSLKERGASIIKVTRADSQSSWKAASSRRIDAMDRIALTGPAKGTKAVHHAAEVQGLWSNGTGGRTPWGTVLAGEQPFDSGAAKAGINPAAVGWIAEAAPAETGFAVRKHTALGRFAHGDVSVALTRDRRVAVYMGSSHALFKFVSSGQYDPLLGTANSALLEDGQLFAADFGGGQWIELTVKAVRAKLEDRAFRVPDGVDQLREDLLDKLEKYSDILVHAHEAALVLGATKLDSGRGLALHPADGSLFIAQTGSAASGNGYGSVLRLIEAGHDAGAAAFESDPAVAGGRLSGISSPDGAAFDSAGRLWLASGIPAERLNTGAYTAFGNNGLFALEASSGTFGKADPFAFAPDQSSLSAPAFGPDGTMFAAVAGKGIAAIRKV